MHIYQILVTSYPGDYDSTEIHNYPFVEEGGRDRGATNYDCTEIHNYPLDEAGGRGHHQLGNYDSTEIHNQPLVE